MRIDAFSRKQKAALTWWCRESPYHKRDAIICDGAVRSGKTLCLSLSFALWALLAAPPGDLALCGKTILSLRRNVVTPLCNMLGQLGISHRLKPSQNYLQIGLGNRQRTIHLFGGKDEGSASHIQGITLSGVLFDEVALMPRSFVEQALARCSVEGSRFFFNCNPEHPHHWFYTEWITRASQRGALYLHFKMEDNPGLSPSVLRRYKSLYTGAFYDRYVLGKWVAAHGQVYPMFSPASIVENTPACSRYAVSCDYGTVNPASFGLWGEIDGIWYRIREFYHDSRASGHIKTDEEYADHLEKLVGDHLIECVVVDPSAASFIACLRRRGKFQVEPAKNDVSDGIRIVADALRSGTILIHKSCADTIREFSLYRWDDRIAGDVPLKRDDHAMDDIRYFALRFLAGDSSPGFCAVALPRLG